MENDVEVIRRSQDYSLMYPEIVYSEVMAIINEEPVFIADVEDESRNKYFWNRYRAQYDGNDRPFFAQEYIVNNYFDPVVGEFGRGTVMYHITVFTGRITVL